jgi:hypothetical protein
MTLASSARVLVCVLLAARDVRKETSAQRVALLGFAPAQRTTPRTHVFPATAALRHATYIACLLRHGWWTTRRSDSDNASHLRESCTSNVLTD